MGLGYTPGALNIECPTPCHHNTHILIENDYENWASARVIRQMPHIELTAVLTPVIKAYHEYVDSESTFFLHGTHPQTLSQAVEALTDEIKEAKEADAIAEN